MMRNFSKLNSESKKMDKHSKDQLTEKNQELEKELALKNRELEIEAAVCLPEARIQWIKHETSPLALKKEA